MPRLHIVVPDEIHVQARVRMLQEHRTLQGTVIELLRAYGQHSLDAPPPPRGAPRPIRGNSRERRQLAKGTKTSSVKSAPQPRLAQAS